MEKELKRAFVSRICKSSNAVLLGNLLGGGTRMEGEAGDTVPEEMTDSETDSGVFGREGGRRGLGCGGGKIALLRNIAVRLAIPPTRRPTIDAQARKM